MHVLRHHGCVPTSSSSVIAVQGANLPVFSLCMSDIAILFAMLNSCMKHCLVELSLLSGALLFCLPATSAASACDVNVCSCLCAQRRQLRWLQQLYLRVNATYALCPRKRPSSLSQAQMDPCGSRRQSCRFSNRCIVVMKQQLLAIFLSHVPLLLTSYTY